MLCCILFSDADKRNYVVKLTFAILGPLIVLIVVAGFLICLLAHRTRRKRPTSSRRKKATLDSEMEPSMLHFNFPSPTSSITYHPPEFVATAAGDSTLKVRSIISFVYHNNYTTKIC